MLRSTRVSPGAACAVAAAGPDHAPARGLSPRAVEQVQRLRGDLRLGLPVVIRDGRRQWLVALVESLGEERLRAMASLGRPELVLTRRRADALGAEAPISAEVLRLPLAQDVQLAWLAALAGMAAPQPATPPTPAARLLPAAPAQIAAVRLAKSAQAMPALLTVSLTATATAQADGLMTIALPTLSEALESGVTPERVSDAPLPTAISQSGHVHVFRPDDGGTEHYAIVVGDPSFNEAVTVRLHSACFTGDVLGSLKCDCGPQLRGALATMAASGGGVLLYLNQEGRGIGLANKMRSYVLQDAGLDTVEANHWLGFEDDQRDFRIGASILHDLGITSVRLLTNNPAKLRILEDQGIRVVERIPLCVGESPVNARYLATKARKSGHLL